MEDKDKDLEIDKTMAYAKLYGKAYGSLMALQFHADIDFKMKIDKILMDLNAEEKKLNA
jgi:hypothetical protein